MEGDNTFFTIGLKKEEKKVSIEIISPFFLTEGKLVLPLAIILYRKAFITKKPPSPPLFSNALKILLAIIFGGE
jgi:hypothetical protein